MRRAHAIYCDLQTVTTQQREGWPRDPSGHAAQRCLIYRIKGRPEADGMLPLDEVIRPILMPRRGFGCTGFLDQNMIMEELHAVRFHQVGRNLRRRRRGDGCVKLRNTPPIKTINKEPPAFAVFQVFGGIGARLCHVAGDTFSQKIDLTPKQSVNQDNTVPLIGFDVRGGDKGGMALAFRLCAAQREGSYHEGRQWSLPNARPSRTQATINWRASSDI